MTAQEMTAAPVEQAGEPQAPFVDRLVERLGRGPDAVIPILQALQKHYRYLPEEALRRVCEISDITPAAIVGVASFYPRFRHRPVGRHLVSVCHGTACHVAGANEITRAIEDALHIKIGDTTPDRAFTLETVSCLGCCSLAPVVMIDSTTHGNVDDRGVTRAIAKARRTDSGAQPCE